ncbi:hypothetical protein PWT90_08156 [Aphanocladium album]|nr:hypothetical protein PWT90_08156 [Aphanocladium album]
MPIKKKDRQAVFDNRDCRTVFSTYPNSELRKRKQILKVVERKRLTFWFSYSAEYLAEIIQSLLLNGDLPYRPSPPVMPAGSKGPATAALLVASPFSLGDAIKSFYLNDQFSDLTAVSHGVRYPLHRIVVCRQSDVFAKACEFKQQQGEDLSKAQNGSFHFDDEIDDQFSEHPEEGNDSTMLVNEILAHVCIFRLAEKYGVRDLQLLARKKFMTAATSNPKVSYLLEALLLEQPECWPAVMKEWSDTHENRSWTNVKRKKLSWYESEFRIVYAAQKNLDFDAHCWAKLDAKFFSAGGSPEDAWKQRLCLLDERVREITEPSVEKKLKDSSNGATIGTNDMQRCEVRNSNILASGHPEPAAHAALRADRGRLRTYAGLLEELDRDGSRYPAKSMADGNMFSLSPQSSSFKCITPDPKGPPPMQYAEHSHNP